VGYRYCTSLLLLYICFFIFYLYVGVIIILYGMVGTIVVHSTYGYLSRRYVGTYVVVRAILWEKEKAGGSWDAP